LVELSVHEAILVGDAARDLVGTLLDLAIELLHYHINPPDGLPKGLAKGSAPAMLKLIPVRTAD
jgi:hypothetical protein